MAAQAVTTQATQIRGRRPLKVLSLSLSLVCNSLYTRASTRPTPAHDNQATAVYPLHHMGIESTTEVPSLNVLQGTLRKDCGRGERCGGACQGAWLIAEARAKAGVADTRQGLGFQ